MSLKSIADAAKHMVLDEDPEPLKTKAPADKVQLPFKSSADDLHTVLRVTTGSPFNVPTTAVVDETVYQGILARTDFKDTKVGRVVIRYFDALDGAGLDTQTRFKSAISQASKLDGLSVDSILMAFDDMKISLQNEVDEFTKMAKANESENITARRSRLAEIDSQIDQLNREKQQISTELNKASMDHSDAIQQFSLASTRRLNEIAEQKVQFASMLGK